MCVFTSLQFGLVRRWVDWLMNLLADISAFSLRSGFGLTICSSVMVGCRFGLSRGLRVLSSCFIVCVCVHIRNLFRMVQAVQKRQGSRPPSR